MWPWRRILGAVGGVGDSAEATGGDVGGARFDDLAAARFRTAAAAADALTAAAGAGDLLVVLEDMQWADHASLFVLREVAGELPASRLLVVATCRDAAGESWRVLLGELARLPGAQVVRLAPLDQAAVAEMLRAAGLTADPGLAELVHARSDGREPSRPTSPAALDEPACSRPSSPWPGWPRGPLTCAYIPSSFRQGSHQPTVGRDRGSAHARYYLARHLICPRCPQAPRQRWTARRADNGQAAPKVPDSPVCANQEDEGCY